jgi:hypothetical protein
LKSIKLTNPNILPSFQQNIQDIQDELSIIKDKIKDKQHDYLSYKTEFEKLKKQNFELKGQFEQKYKLNKIINRQYEKYGLINTNRETNSKLLNNLLKDMKDFKYTSTNHYEKEIKRKKGQYNRIEYQVSEIQAEILSSKKEFEIVKNEIMNKNHSITERNLLNSKIFLEHKSSLLLYLNSFVKLKRIFRDLGENDIGAIISKFKSERIQYQGKNLNVS